MTKTYVICSVSPHPGGDRFYRGPAYDSDGKVTGTYWTANPANADHFTDCTEAEKFAAAFWTVCAKVRETT